MPPVKMIACHYANRSGRGIPATFLPVDVVNEMYEAGLVEWNKRHTYVNFRKTEAQLTPAQRSVKMGPEVTFGCACGDPGDLALQEAWRWKYAA